MGCLKIFWVKVKRTCIRVLEEGIHEEFIIHIYFSFEICTKNLYFLRSILIMCPVEICVLVLDLYIRENWLENWSLLHFFEFIVDLTCQIDVLTNISYFIQNLCKDNANAINQFF